MNTSIRQRADRLFRYASFIAVAAGITSTVPFKAGAVMLLGTSDPGANTSAPTGPLTGSGWDYVGVWGGTVGTAVGPHHFIASKHIGGSVGDTFVYEGNNFTTTASYDSPTSDLRIWAVNGTLPGYAQLFRGNDEAGRNLVVIGRGATRGDAIVLNTVGESAGWREGNGAGMQRWGENSVASIVSRPGLGELLRFNFDRNAGANEAMLSPGDSGGAVFIQEQGTWKLAGINYGISGPYNETSTGGGFFGAIYDTGGLYGQVGSSWVPIFNQGFDVPAYSESTRISAHRDWIEGITAIPEPWEWASLTSAGLALFAWARRVTTRPGKSTLLNL
jgi:hypothetical protein